MAVSAINAVWEWRGAAHASEKLVLMAFADWANDDGLCWPSIRRVAWKCDLSTDQARRIVHELQKKGILEVLANATGGAPGQTPVYRVVLAKLIHTASADARGGVDARAGTGAGDSLHRRSQTACIGASLTTIEPLITTKRANARARENALTRAKRAATESAVKAAIQAAKLALTPGNRPSKQLESRPPEGTVKPPRPGDAGPPVQAYGLAFRPLGGLAAPHPLRGRLPPQPPQVFQVMRFTSQKRPTDAFQP